MCGRYTAKTPASKLRQLFGLEGGETELPPHYNVAPSQPVPAVRNDGRRKLELLRWGLVPWWAKEAKVGHKMINTRAESLETKFREAFQHRRCLVLADGFYEWRREGRHKTPFYIRRKDGQPFAFAGIWESWRQPQQEPLRTCSVITVPANPLVAKLHDRMPAVLTSPDQRDLWLNPEDVDPAQLQQLLRPWDPSEWEAYPVSAAVNSPLTDDPRLIEPVPDAPARPANGELFPNSD